MTTVSPLPFAAPSTPASPRPASPPIPSTAPRRFRLRARHVVLTLAGMFALLVVALVLSFRLGSETRTLRQVALASVPGTWDRQFELGVGRLPVLIAKAGLGFVPLEPEARAALAAFESADVSIYQRRHGTPTSDLSTSSPDVLAAVSQAMANHGWEPLVRVRDGHDTVGIFVPVDTGRATSLRACILVLDGDDLVMVSARANPGPLVELALRRAQGLPFAAR